MPAPKASANEEPESTEDSKGSKGIQLRKKRPSSKQEVLPKEGIVKPNSFVNFDHLKLLTQDMLAQNLGKKPPQEQKSIDSQVIINRIPVQFIEPSCEQQQHPPLPEPRYIKILSPH